jgi:hypothetical protein
MASATPRHPDLSRLTCPRCGHSAVFATWCGDSCCEQSPERFLLGDLPRVARDAGVPAFAVRYLTPPRGYSADLAVRIWRAGSLTPLFTGRLADAVEFTMSHDCHQVPPGVLARG